MAPVRNPIYAGCVQMKRAVVKVFEFRVTVTKFLKDLQRYNSSCVFAMFGNEFDRATLFCGATLVVGVDKNIGIEETTCAHGSHRD
jgi:hypothetical protein